MGFLDFLFKKNYNDEDIVGPVNDYAYYKGIDPLPIEYSDKGVGKCKSKKNPWRAYLSFSTRDGNGSKTKTFSYHIGQYPTREEAQKARWEFIESLK